MANCVPTTERRSPKTATPLTGRRRLGAALLTVGAGSLLTSGIAAGAAASVVDYAEADASLIAICSAAEAAEDRADLVWRAVSHMPSSDSRVTAASDECMRLGEQCRDAMDRVTQMKARTAAGIRAKASLALRELNYEDEESLSLVRSVLLQLAGRTAA